MSDELKTLPRSLRRGPVSWMAGNSVAANLIMLVCLLGGLFMAGKVRQEVFPDVALDIVQVLVPYPASTPEDVEKGILLSIEDAVESLDGVDDVTSTAREGMGEVRVEMRVGEDILRPCLGLMLDGLGPLIALLHAGLVEMLRQFLDLRLHRQSPAP